MRLPHRSAGATLQALYGKYDKHAVLAEGWSFEFTLHHTSAHDARRRAHCTGKGPISFDENFDAIRGNRGALIRVAIQAQGVVE
jgi:hypothetical protein